jgi:hypothetical protein
VLLAWIKRGDDHSKATRAEICRPRWPRWLANQAVSCLLSAVAGPVQDGKRPREQIVRTAQNLGQPRGEQDSGLGAYQDREREHDQDAGEGRAHGCLLVDHDRKERSTLTASVLVLSCHMLG